MMGNQSSNRLVKIAAISDTHGNNEELEKAIKDNISGDIFIHAGDYTSYNKKQHVNQFLSLIAKLNFKHKIVIPGNHEILLDSSLNLSDLNALGVFIINQDMTRQSQIQKFKQIGVIYLEHQYIQIQGVRIFASPYTNVPPYWMTAFQITQQKLKQIWDGVPSKIDLLITHGPPFGILDKTVKQEHAGSQVIKQFIQNYSPKVHIFGHIHESKGKVQHNNTMCFNVAQTLKIIELEVPTQ